MIILGLVVSVCCAPACSEVRRLAHIQQESLSMSISLPNSRVDESSFRDIEVPEIKQDTIKVNIEGREMVIMKAIRDEETGEMVATEELTAAVVTARFRNVAERHGKVDLEFEIRVPKELMASDWQLRFYPDMYIMEDSVRLDKVLITGEDYRYTQLRGYQQYDRFLRRIISDTTKFVDIRNLEIFLRRNIPQIYAFKNDTTFVSDEKFSSCFGITERDAVEHYTNKFSKNMNDRRVAKKSKMYNKYVRVPISMKGVRLDTVLTDMSNDFVYKYIQTIETRKGLRKVDIVLSGEIYRQDVKLYEMSRTEPLTFFISSVSAFVDRTPRYKLKVIERRAEANAAWNVDFKVGRSDIDETLGSNSESLSDIKRNITALLKDEVYDLDSITVAAFASPEGSQLLNKRLSEARSQSAVRYFNDYSKRIVDSLRAEEGMHIMVGDDMEESAMIKQNSARSDIRFKTSASGENWDYLTVLVNKEDDECGFSSEERELYNSALEVSDLDKRELVLKGSPDFYARLKKDVYPKLRTVQFNFFLHRKGMVKDTVHTTELDTTYMRGVQLLADRDYDGAAFVLGPYSDYNTAIAYVSLDRNVSALRILESLKPSPKINYMLALLYSRRGDDRMAVEKYLTACSQDRSFVFRGNLDPEIASLIRKYGLNQEPEEEEFEY